MSAWSNLDPRMSVSLGRHWGHVNGGVHASDGILAHKDSLIEDQGTGDDGSSFEQLCALLPRCYQKEFSRPISRCRVVKILVNWDWVGPSFSGAFLPQCASFRNSR